MVDTLLFSVAFVIMIALAFIAGLKLSDHYHAVASVEKKYALEKQYLRLSTGRDADDPVQPYVAHPNNRFELPDEFAERLVTNKSATMQVPLKKQSDGIRTQAPGTIL